MPISPLEFSVGANYRNFRVYGTEEYNFFILANWTITLEDWCEVVLSHGVNSKVVNLDIYSSDWAYGQDWIAETYLSWNWASLFFLNKIYTLGFSFGNRSFEEALSFGYMQLENMNIFYINEDLSILFNTGIGFVGTGSLAGYINRFWITSGVLYEIPF